MQELFDRFPAELSEDDQGSWEILIEPGPDSTRQLSELLGVVQGWVDGSNRHMATIRFEKRTYTLDYRSADLPLTREAERVLATRLRAAPRARV